MALMLGIGMLLWNVHVQQKEGAVEALTRDRCHRGISEVVDP